MVMLKYCYPIYTYRGQFESCKSCSQIMNLGLSFDVNKLLKKERKKRSTEENKFVV